MAVPKRTATQIKFPSLSLLQWLLIATFLKGIVFMAVTPLWHTPDEQAHFAQVQYIAEFGHNWPNDNRVDNLSQEVLLSERYLGTERDEFGRNRFTHHPEYRLDYTQTLVGQYEEVIKNVPLAARTTMVKKEATRYPVLYYYVAALFYRLGYSLDLFNRVMLARVPSLLMSITMVYLGFCLAKLVFPKEKVAAVTATLLISFQPMFSFLSVGVTSDNLMNLLFTWFLLLGARIIVRKRFTIKDGILLVLALIALKLTKPHYVIAIPIVLTLPLFFPKASWLLFIRRHALKLAGGVVALVFLWRPLGLPIPSPEVVIIPALTKPNFPFSLTEHVLWTLRHTIAEVIPWYWGVFNWLGVTLPRSVNRVINRVLIIAAVGVGLWLFNLLKRRKLEDEEKVTLFLGISSGIFFAVLMLWDWVFRRHYNFSFGMQGRYYFPLLSAQMILMVVGLRTLIPQKLARFKDMWLKIVGLGAIILNSVGLYTIAKAYYDVNSWNIFLTQVSQYKPLYFKNPWIVVWFALYAVALVGWVIHYLTYETHQRSRS